VALRRLSRLNGYNCIRIAENDEWKTASRKGYGLLEYLGLGCHLPSEGIAISPAKIQPIEDWAAPRSIKNLQQFLGFAEKHEEHSEVRGRCEPLWLCRRQRYSQSRIEPCREASRTFCSSWGFAKKCQERFALQAYIAGIQPIEG
jgi:hypothetical protein